MWLFTAASSECERIGRKMILELKPAGIVFTGGNSLTKYGGDAPERDETEYAMLKLALQYNIPVYGFCRGMQTILDFYGCELNNVTGHVAVRHDIEGTLGKRNVNSFHNQACLHANDLVEVLARTEDGVIEAVRIKSQKIAATMWHPEREQNFKKEDIELVQKLFGEE